ncbi:TetR/AcrR family transcriptional regulator [Parafrankia discariae]|uniref:TetR/AcrR family transcriptional regulator n=1 Tax=Parafrankia discariae TaxID=365528 RepID=UPI00036A3612|nr:TetR/AcrR family transcriptional regulator [Parafrankia discariae]
MRSDARRNRELISDTARELFTERGAAVSMEEIAGAAGLGVGTLYRHFPDRAALLEAVAADTLGRFLALGRAEAARDLPGWQVLLRVIEHCTRLPLALVKTLAEGVAATPEVAGLTTEAEDLLVGVVERAQRERTLRPDIPPREVVKILNVVVCRPGARADDHLITVMLDGLRAGGPPRASAPGPGDAALSAGLRA